MTADEAVETALAMAKVQDGYAERATDPEMKLIHKANANAQREVAAVITDKTAKLDRLEAAAMRLKAVLNQNDTKGPIPDVAMMFCWMAAQDVRAALGAKP
jgi:hypothetical protein